MRHYKGSVFYDSARVAEQMGTRGGIYEDRSLVFVAPPANVDLMVHGGMGDFCYVTGQVLDPLGDTPMPDVEVCLGAEGEAHVKTDEFGQFTLGGQVTGEEPVLTMTFDDAELVCRVPDLD